MNKRNPQHSTTMKIHIFPENSIVIMEYRMDGSEFVLMIRIGLLVICMLDEYHGISQYGHQVNQSTGIHVQDYLIGRCYKWTSNSDRQRVNYHQHQTKNNNIKDDP